MRLKLIKWLLKPVIKNLREKGNTGKYKELSDKLFEISKGLTHRIVSEYNTETIQFQLDPEYVDDLIYFYLLRNLDN